MGYLVNAGTFLITSVFGFFICVFIVRTMLIAIGASFYEPVCRFVYLVTNPAIKPIRTLIPRWRRIELSSLLIAWLLCLIEMVLIVTMFGLPVGVAGLLLHAFVDLVDWAILIQLVAIIAYCILSFFPGVRYDGNFMLLGRFIEPVVGPFRRLVPEFGGLDLSCWVASIALILARMLIIAPLTDFASRLS